MSIHPFLFIFFHLFVFEMWTQHAQERNPDILLHSDIFQLLLGDLKYSGQRGCIIPAVSSGSAPGSSPSRICRENLLREMPKMHTNQMPKPRQLTPFCAKKLQLYFDLPTDDGAPYLISKAELGHPKKEVHFTRLYPGSGSFGRDSYPHHRWGLEHRWTNKSRGLLSALAFLFTTTDWSNATD